jgi:glycosyltransferase involved in cell wall biosynthesis
MGDGDKRPFYEELVLKEGIKNVVFYPFVDRISALKIIAGAQVGLHAFGANRHWDYVLGNKVFDYLVMGTPVLFAGGGTTAELVEKSGGGEVCQPGDPKEVAEALRILLAEAEEYKKTPVGREYVLKHWRRSAQTREFINGLNCAFSR